MFCGYRMKLLEKNRYPRFVTIVLLIRMNASVALVATSF
jgi:hypothetical protein